MRAPTSTGLAASLTSCLPDYRVQETERNGYGLGSSHRSSRATLHTFGVADLQIARARSHVMFGKGSKTGHSL